MFTCRQNTNTRNSLHVQEQGGAGGEHAEVLVHPEFYFSFASWMQRWSQTDQNKFNVVMTGLKLGQVRL